MSEWIKVTHQLPPSYTFVLVCEKNNGTGEPCPIAVARHDGIRWDVIMGGGWQDLIWPIDNVTHWMPFPPLPRD